MNQIEHKAFMAMRCALTNLREDMVMLMSGEWEDSAGGWNAASSSISMIDLALAHAAKALRKPKPEQQQALNLT
jgi:hypothetical protein